jgi:lysozyme family protein
VARFLFLVQAPPIFLSKHSEIEIMEAPIYTPELKSSYQRLFDTCTIKPERFPEVDRIAEKIAANRPVYELVGSKLGIPWYFIGIVHNMEASGTSMLTCAMEIR